MIFFHGILIFKGKNLTSQVRYIKVRNCFVVSRLWTINLSKEFFIWNSCNVYSYFCKKWAQKKGFIPFYACFTYTTFTESKLSESSLTIDLEVLKIRKKSMISDADSYIINMYMKRTLVLIENGLILYPK